MPEGALGYYNVSAWNTTSCPYLCNDGITPVQSNKMCLGTYELFLYDIGGPVVFALMIISAILVVFIVIYFLAETKKSKSLDKLIEKKNKEIDGDGNKENLKYLHQEFKFFDRDVF
jgi:hypothetical protein